jgi:hypothetical protein
MSGTEQRRRACGAKTRTGAPCKRTDVYRNGRCKFHGGLSTGPRTDFGRAAARANLALRHGRAQPADPADTESTSADVLLARMKPRADWLRSPPAAGLSDPDVAARLYDRFAAACEALRDGRSATEIEIGGDRA